MKSKAPKKATLNSSGRVAHIVLAKCRLKRRLRLDAAHHQSAAPTKNDPGNTRCSTPTLFSAAIQPGLQTSVFGRFD
jgi:hypothetical protein